MEKQRDLDEQSYEANLRVKAEVVKLIEKCLQTFEYDPAVLTLLNRSQELFELYLTNQLLLVSSIMGGTVDPLLRNATSAEILRQRVAVLEMLLSDVAPDRI